MDEERQSENEAAESGLDSQADPTEVEEAPDEQSATGEASVDPRDRKSGGGKGRTS